MQRRQFFDFLQSLRIPFALRAMYVRQLVTISMLLIILLSLISYVFSVIQAKQSTVYSMPLYDQTPLHTLKFLNHNNTLETTIACVGSLYNQSCLYTNLYYVDSTFTIFTLHGKNLSNFSVRTDAFYLWDITPKIRVFDSYSHLEKFVRNVIHPKVISSVTLHFGQPWHSNIGHALFDGLYPAYVALIRFPPRHLHPFRILASIDHCDDCWSEDVYSRFAGLGLIKKRVLDRMSNTRWFMFDELIMGSGTLCQRCIQPNLQLPGGVELDGSRLFRDRMYQQHSLFPSIVRQKSSAEHRTSRDVLLASIFHNKRFTSEDQKQIHDAIDEINNYTKSHFNQSQLQWPLINVTYVYYNHIKAVYLNTTEINRTSIDSRSPTYELLDNDFIAQLKLVQQTDIHICGPGTGQMYQTFLSDGSVHINLGGIRPWGLENMQEAYTSYLEQYMTSGTPYIKGLFYSINQRTKGIKKDEVVRLIREAGEMILGGFKLPVDPINNLAADGQLFVEMCQRDRDFCSLVTNRSTSINFNCVDLWVEDFVHEHRQWKLGGFLDGKQNISCAFNHTLLRELRYKYGIKHHSDK